MADCGVWASHVQACIVACLHIFLFCRPKPSFNAGRDPKPWPPPFKLSREMVEAMGGAESELYRAFCAHACEAYNILRKSAGLILSLFHLMAGAAIPDIRSDPEKAMLKLQARAPSCRPQIYLHYNLQDIHLLLRPLPLSIITFLSSCFVTSFTLRRLSLDHSKLARIPRAVAHVALNIKAPSKAARSCALLAAR